MLIGHSWADLNGTILQIDEPVADLLRRRRRDIEGLSYLSITHPADRARNTAFVSALRPGAGPQPIRKRYLGGDGSEIWVTLHTAHVGTGATAGHLVGTFLAERCEDEPRRLWRQAAQLIDMYRLRDSLLDRQLFADHAFVIMLHIYRAEAEGRAMSLADLSRVIRKPEGFVRTWMNALVSSGMVSIAKAAMSNYELTLLGITRLEGVLSGSAARSVSAVNGE